MTPWMTDGPYMLAAPGHECRAGIVHKERAILCALVRDHVAEHLAPWNDAGRWLAWPNVNAPPPARPWACPCCGGETEAVTCPVSNTPVRWCTPCSMKWDLEWWQITDRAKMGSRACHNATHRSKCEAEPGVSRRTAEASGEPAAGTNGHAPAPSQHAGIVCVACGTGVVCSCPATAPKAPPPLCAYCDVPHPAAAACAMREKIRHVFATNEIVWRDDYRRAPWQPLSVLAIEDAQRGRPDWRGSQRPCDECGLRACPHPRAKAGW